jgi:uncharacterized protein YgfB (UPF0149 family)
MGRTGGRQKRVRGDFELSLHKSILEKKKNDGTAYSERTVDTIVNNLQKLHRQIFGDEEIMTNLVWLEDADKVITFIQSFKNKGNYSFTSHYGVRRRTPITLLGRTG